MKGTLVWQEEEEKLHLSLIITHDSAILSMDLKFKKELQKLDLSLKSNNYKSPFVMNQGSAMIHIVDFKSKQEPRFEERKKYSKIH